jgi:hypothetical protein
MQETCDGKLNESQSMLWKDIAPPLIVNSSLYTAANPAHGHTAVEKGHRLSVLSFAVLDHQL